MFGKTSIERILKVSNVLILNWIKNIGKNIERIINNNDIEKKKNKKNINILEMDKLYSYVKKNENTSQMLARYQIYLII